MICLHPCETKKHYRSKESAGRAAKRYVKTVGTYQRPYKCPYCNRWHLTTRVERSDECS